MTLRSTLSDAARRAFVGISRATLVKADDSKKWQELRLRGEIRRDFSNVEVAHPYGFTAVGKPPADDKTSDVAELVIAYLDGDMSHPIVLVVGDRRYRLKNLQEGEVALYDDLGQKVHLTRNGIVIDAGDQKKPITVKCGNATFVVQDGKIKGDVSGTPIAVSPNRVDLGEDPASHAVVTVDGPSTVVFAKL